MAVVNFAEASITSLSVAKLKSLKAIYGGPFWIAARRWLDHPEEYLTLLLFFQNMLEVLFAWLLLAWLALWFEIETVRDLAAWVFGGTVNLFFLTIYPKVLGRKLSHGILGVWILRILYGLLLPFYPFLHFFFKAIARLSGARLQAAGTLGRGVYLSLEELRELVDSAQTVAPSGLGGASVDSQVLDLERGVMDMMGRYLRLKDVLVRDVMTPRSRVSTVNWESFKKAPPGSPQKERVLFTLMTDGHTRTLALWNDVPAGYLHIKDMLGMLAEGFAGGAASSLDMEGGALAERLILRPIPAVHARQKLINVINLLFRGYPVAYVTDGNEWTGLITAEDCLEEITGEILDEFEHRKRPPRPTREPVR